MSQEQESASFEKFRSAVNWAQEQAGFPSFVIAVGYFQREGRFYAAHMGMTEGSTSKNEITMQPLLAATFVAAVRAQCEQYIREIVRTLVESGRAMGAGEDELTKMCGDFEDAFRQRMGVEEANFLKAWGPPKGA
jgi:hypothetical protein